MSQDHNPYTERKLMSSLFNQMCDPCIVIPLLPIYYINQLLLV